MLNIVSDILVKQEIEINEARPLSLGSTNDLMRQGGFDSKWIEI